MDSFTHKGFTSLWFSKKELGSYVRYAFWYHITGDHDLATMMHNEDGMYSHISASASDGRSLSKQFGEESFDRSVVTSIPIKLPWGENSSTEFLKDWNLSSKFVEEYKTMASTKTMPKTYDGMRILSLFLSNTTMADNGRALYNNSQTAGAESKEDLPRLKTEHEEDRQRIEKVFDGNVKDEDKVFVYCNDFALGYSGMVMMEYAHNRIRRGRIPNVFLSGQPGNFVQTMDELESLRRPGMIQYASSFFQFAIITNLLLTNYFDSIERTLKAVMLIHKSTPRGINKLYAKADVNIKLDNYREWQKMKNNKSVERELRDFSKTDIRKLDQEEKETAA